MGKRRGISLVELMLTLSACCFILTLSAGLIHRAMHAQSKARLFFDSERSARRLGQSFRRDVHDAQSAELGDGDTLLRLEIPGGNTVLYRQSAGRIERTWHVAGEPRAREAFVFPSETRFTVAKPSERLVTLAINDPADPVGKPGDPLPAYAFPVSLELQALLGRNASLVEVADTAEKSP